MHRKKKCPRGWDCEEDDGPTVERTAGELKTGSTIPDENRAKEKEKEDGSAFQEAGREVGRER